MKKIVVVLIVIVILVGVSVIALDQRLIVRNYEVASDLVNEPIRLVVISDLHSTVYGEGQEVLIKLIAAQEPDVILLAGDIVDNNLPEEPAYLFMEKVVEIAPTYYVMGNHEFWSGFAGGIRQEATILGVNVLRNEMATMSVGEQTIAIYGIDDPEFVKYEHRDGDDWAVALGNLWQENPFEGFKILISHHPEKVGVYRQFDFDLIVSGHAHGGQVRIPFLVNGLAAPDQGLFPKYAGGDYQLSDETRLIVSRGTVINSYPRVFNRPEVVVIDLQ